MKQFYLFVLFLLLAPAFAGAQAISINTDASNPDPSAILDVKSSVKGMLVPRMTTAQRNLIAAPAAGLLVYDTDIDGFWFFNGTAWTNLSAGGTPASFIADADGNTKVQTEETANEDIIRFDLGGTESMVLRKNIDGNTRLEFPSNLFNTFVGQNAGNANTIGFANTANGVQALLFNTTGGQNTATGYGSLYFNTIGANNTANGAQTLFNNTTGNDNTANGGSALRFNTTGNYNTANGLNALRFNTTGYSNVAVGKDALFYNTTRSNLVAVGDSALYNNGVGAIQAFEATSNTAVGSKALFSNTAGYYNTANGVNALYSNTTGYQNTANGYNALFSNTSGTLNTANGWAALSSNTSGDQNTANGFYALRDNTTGNFNTANGSQVLLSNTTGNFNTASGSGALLGNTTGSNNTANGYLALQNNTTGSNNTALGYNADVLFFLGDLTNATAIGYNAKVGASNSLVLGGTGADAVSVGVGTEIPDASAVLDLASTDKGLLAPRMTTVERTAIAAPATGLLVYDTDTNSFWFYNGTAWAKISPQTLLADADNNTKIQVEKNPNEDIIRFDLGGTENMVLRKNAGGTTRLELGDGGSNTFIGVASGSANTASSANTAVGANTLKANTTGSNNTASGFNALFLNTTGSLNSAFGDFALVDNTAGNGNTSVGASAMDSNSSGSNNTAVGRSALNSNASGSNNTALGYDADVTTFDLTNATAIGYKAKVGASNSLVLGGTGVNAVNVGIGVTSPAATLHVNGSIIAKGVSDADNNTKIQVEESANEDIIRFDLAGTESMVLQKNAGGSPRLELLNALDNTFVGKNTGSANTTGNFNTALGANSLNANTSGFGNLALGQSAMEGNTTGSNNVCVGTNSNVGSGTLSNATAIGRATTVNASNKVRIGNSIVTVIEGQVAYTFPSDARFKFNIHDDQVPGLAFIEKLRPVTYQFDTRKFDEHLMQNMPDSIRQRRLAGQDYRESTAIIQTGFLAQEVEQACKDLRFEFSGLHVPTSAVDNYGIAYGSFVPLLVKGMQEQQVVIEALKAENVAQKAENAAMKAQLDKITAALQTAGIGVGN